MPYRSRLSSRVLARGLMCLFVAAATITACGDDKEPAPSLSANTTPVAGTLVLPDGVVAATVINGITEATVVDGAFTLGTLTGVDATGQTLAVAVSANGTPLLMGWFGPDATELSPRSTAEVLAWFAVGAFTAPLEVATTVRGLLAESPALEPLSDTIASELAASPEAFGDDNAAVTEALRVAANALMINDAPVRRALLINPGTAKSGVTLNQVTGVNEITLTNTYRRPAFALVDRVSTFDEDGNETASPAKTARMDLDPVTGLDGGVGTINQIITGLARTGGSFEGADLAYTPKSASPIALPNVEGAKKTRYHVVVVGPGGFEGDYAQLGDEAKAKQAEVVQTFVIKQLILPLVIQLLVPSTDLDRVKGVGGFTDLVQDFINITAVQAPQIFDLASQGDLKGAVTLGGQTIVGSATFRNAIFEATIERLYDLSTEAGDAAYGRASAVASGFIKVTGALDTFLTAFDLTAVAANFAQSNEGDLWVVDAIGAKVVLSPPTNDIKTGATVRLTATTPDVGDDVPKAYRFSVTPTNLGQLRNSRTNGATIDTSENFIDFEAGDTEGSVTVTVEVFQIDNANRIPLGDATATITIEEGCEFDEDDIQRVTVQKWVGIAPGEGFGGDDAAKAYWYFVWELKPGVAPYALTFRAGPNGDLFGNSTPQRDGNTITVRPIQPLGQYSYRYSTAESLPRRESDAFAAAVALSDTQGIYILTKAAQPLNENHDQLDEFYERVDEINAKQEGTMAEFLPKCE